MPQGTGYGSLGDAIGLALGGGDIDRQGAFNEGLNTGSQIKYRSAQTRDALARARERTDKAERLAQVEKDADDLAAQLGIPKSLVMSGLAGIDPQQFTGAASETQNIGFRNTIADASLPFADRQASAQAVSGVPLAASDFLGPGGELFVDVFNPSADAVTPTPTGVAQIGADEALAGERLADAALTEAKTANPELFRSGGVTINTGGGLGDEILNPEGSLNLGDDPSDAFGLAGAFGQTVNALSDVLPGVGQAFPDVDKTATAMNVLRQNSLGAALLDYPGRPTNWIAQRIDSEFPNAASIFQGDQSAITKITQLRDALNRELTVQAQLLPTFENKGTRDKARSATAQMAQLVADYDQFLGAIEPTQAVTPAGELPAGWTVETVD